MLTSPLSQTSVVLSSSHYISSPSRGYHIIMSDRPTPVRQPSLDPATVNVLEKKLQQRPEKDELVNRNILKEGKVAPALQAAKERLERSQLEDKLETALKSRPKQEELVKDGILLPEEAPTTSS